MQEMVTLTLVVRKEEDCWLGECVELGTVTFGDTFEEVHNELPLLIRQHLDELEESGEREHFFRTHGIVTWRAGQSSAVLPPPPASAADPNVYFNFQQASLAAPVSLPV